MLFSCFFDFIDPKTSKMTEIHMALELFLVRFARLSAPPSRAEGPQLRTRAHQRTRPVAPPCAASFGATPDTRLTSIPIGSRPLSRLPSARKAGGSWASPSSARARNPPLRPGIGAPRKRPRSRCQAHRASIHCGLDQGFIMP